MQGLSGDIDVLEAYPAGSLVFGAGMVLGAAQFLEWLELTDDTIACG